MHPYFILILLKISLCAGWNYHGGLTMPGYSSGVASLSVPDPDNCVLTCLSYYASHLEFILVTATIPSMVSCYCVSYVYNSINDQPDAMHLLLWRPPVNFNDNPLQIGQSYTAYVYVNEFIGGNDTFYIYVTKDLQDPTKESSSIIIDSWANLPDSSLNADGPRYLQRSEISKRDISIMETFPTLTYYIMPHYTFTFMVTDTGVVDLETNWFVSVFTNEKIVLVDLKPYEVSRPAKDCTVEVETSSQLYSEEDYRVKYHIKTADGCVADIENVTITLVAENILDGEPVFNDSCINPTEYKKAGSTISVKFSRLFIRSEICFMVTYKAVRSLRGIGAKKVLILNDLTYTEFENDVATEVKKNDTFSVYISRGVQGFLIRDVPDGYCISKSKSDNTLKATLNGCNFFKLGQHNLVSASGGCMSLDGTTPVIKQCDKKRNIKIKERDIEFVKENQFLYENNVDVSLSSASGSYQRRYRGAFGLNGGQSHGSDNIGNSTGISIAVGGKNFIVCANPNKRNQRCAILFTETRKVTNLNRRMYTVVGYNEKTGSIYGESEKGNKLIIDKSHGVVFAGARYWASIVNSPNMTWAKHFVQKDLLHTTTENEFVIDGTTYKATYYGIMDTSSLEYIVIWTPEKDCHLTVGKSEEAALPTCMEIKRFCKKAKSGVYWIGGLTMSNKGQVYCDMEADGGGWVMIANYTVDDGIMRTISGNLTTNIYDVATSNFEKYLDYSGLSSLNGMIGFEEIRFYCFADRPGRTVHLASVKGPKSATPKAAYMTTGSVAHGTACDSYSVFNDDTSLLKDMCSDWGDEGGTINRWGARTEPHRIYDKAIGKINNNVFDMGVTSPSTLTCDSFNEKPLKHGIWQVYVR